MDNPYLRELDGKIVKKEFKNNKSYIQLDKTIFYPDLVGGQPMDYGTINGLDVINVYEEDDSIVHVVKGDLTATRVHMNIDWDRRFDMMQQHSGEHILASSFYRLFNLTNLGIHIGNEYNTIDIDKSSLSKDEAIKVEFLANKIVQSNFKVKSYDVNREQLSKIPLRKDSIIEDEKIRIIEIDNIDYIACCGTHVSSTGEIGLIKILKWEKYKGHIRVEFICGNRALRDYSWKNDYINEIGSILSASDSDILNRVNQLYDSKISLEKENKSIRGELYDIKGELLVKDIIIDKNTNFIIKEFKDMDIKEISLIASNLNKNQENLTQIYSIINGEKGHFVIVRSKDLDINLNKIFDDISNKFTIKGGGNSQHIQGVLSVSDLSSVINMFKKEIKNKIK